MNRFLFILIALYLIGCQRKPAFQSGTCVSLKIKSGHYELARIKYCDLDGMCYAYNNEYFYSGPAEAVEKFPEEFCRSKGI